MDNAAGRRTIEMPTSGACVVVPAILEYFNYFVFMNIKKKK